MRTRNYLALGHAYLTLFCALLTRRDAKPRQATPIPRCTSAMPERISGVIQESS